MAKQTVGNPIQAYVVEALAGGASAISYYEGEVTKDPDWATRKQDDGTVTLAESAFVSFTVNTGGSYATVRAFDETLVGFALGLGGGSRIAVAVEPVNKRRPDGSWSTYLRALAVTAITVVDRVADTDRDGAVARRVVVESAPRAQRQTLVL